MNTTPNTAPNTIPNVSNSFETYLPSYSVQDAGARARILVTVQGATTTLVTVDKPAAARISAKLSELAEVRAQFLHVHARLNPGEVCYARRNMMAALLAGATRLPGRDGHMELLTAAAGCSDAERRAISEEVGRLLDGTEDVIVPCYVEDGTGEVSVLEIANGWLLEELATTSPAAVANMLADLVEGESGWLFEGLLAHLRSQDTENGELIDAIADRHWVDVDIDQRALVAWMRRHLPGHLDELEGVCDDPANPEELPEFTAGAHLLAHLIG